MGNGINVTKKDVVWSFVAKFFQMATGVITLPLILRYLSSDEIALNYLMLTVSSMVALLDFGFAPQFGRNFTYIYSGARVLRKEGVEINQTNDIDYYLLSVLLVTAKQIYRKISVACLLIMLSGGTLYIYYVTKGFSLVQYSFWIWLFFSFSTYFTIYCSFYNSLLTGSGKITEANKAIIISKIVYIVICSGLLLLKMGLFSVVIATFTAPFIQRLYSHRTYYTRELKEKLDPIISSSEIKDMFNVIWYNARKLGINFVGGYAITKSSMFIIGFFLPMSDIASYGLITQLGAVVLAVAQTLFVTYQPKFSNCRVNGDTKRFKEIMSVTMVFYLTIMVLGYLFIVFCMDYVLVFIKSNASLPSLLVITIYFIQITLEGNHSNFASLIVTGNKVPFVKPSLISGGLIILFTVLILKYTSLELVGVVLVPFIVQLAYNNWKWPKWVLEEYHMSYLNMIKLGFVQSGQFFSSSLYKIKNKS